MMTNPSFKIYKFGPTTDGNASMKDILGGKGANLAEMSSMGIPVPPGFTIPCEASVTFNSVTGPGLQVFKDVVQGLINQGMTYLKDTNDTNYPLVSVRSGARVSMPGMMDTILNVGMTSETLPVWTKLIGKRAALDSYRRLIQMYASVALGVDMALFDECLDSLKSDVGVKVDSELSEDHLSRLVKRYLAIVLEGTGKPFPDTLEDQVRGAVYAVFKSWNNPRAIEYRKINNYPDDWGTAVTVQSMVFGNMNDDSCTGVLFSRDPSTGAKKITGEFLVNAQGEDVVAGIRTPEPLDAMQKWNQGLFSELTLRVTLLEAHYKDMQDIEFTVQGGKLFLLQTRNGKRSALAAFKIAHDLVKEGLITKDEAASRVSAAQLFSVMQDSIDPSFKAPADLMGIAGGGGVVSGVAMFTADSAVNCKVPCILVTKETNPDDIAGMNAAVGILTATGGLTSHAAVVARGMNKSCVVGATSMVIQSLGHGAFTGYIPEMGSFVEGDKLTIDGATGKVWIKKNVPLIAGGASRVVREVSSWCATDHKVDRLEITYAHDTVAKMEEVLKQSTADEVYIDTVLLEGPDRFKSDSVGDRMMMLCTALVSACKAKKIIIDLSGRVDHYSRGDNVMDFMFGLTSSFDVKLFVSKAAALNAFAGKLKSRVVIKLGSDNEGMASDFKNIGYSVVGYIKTFDDLLKSNGPVTVSDKIIKEVFGSKEAFEFAKAAVSKQVGEGVLEALATPGYWYQSLTAKVV